MPTQFESPTAECDLIMQGGVTSGVVYPGAVLKLAEHYRFRCIGGTSAGAIAAAAAAAAELGRSNGGFDRLSKLPNELGECLLSLFQPARPFRGVFALFLGCLGNRPIGIKTLKLLGLLLRHFLPTLLLGLAPSVLYLCLRAPKNHWPDYALFVFIAFTQVFIALILHLMVLLLVSLPKNLFGVCPGLAQSCNGKPALCEWLTDLFDRTAGLTTAAGPLTFGALKAAGIELKMMTTNLSGRRPYSLPFITHPGHPERDARYCYRESEWARYFPKRIMTWLEGHTIPVDGNSGYRYLPDADALPVIVAVRMSLSFPFLLSAIPLYRQDWTYRSKADYSQLRRCVFSDGGISSNFPIQFFDNLLPTRPTFAIALRDYSPLRYASDNPHDRVTMPVPQHPDQGFLLPITTVASLFGFIGAIIDTARNWQDNLQSTLAGYRERIVNVALTEAEGGLNLNMDADLIMDLHGLGSIAGDHMLNFDLRAHQWRRFLVAYARLEDSFEHMNKAYAGGFDAFLNTYPPKTIGYVPTQQWFDDVHARINALLTLTEQWNQPALRSCGKIPKPDTDLSITPKP
jgi:predicted acylesterase/phospholipase RssA